MSKINQRDALKKALEARGYHIVSLKCTSKSICMKKGDDAGTIFLGKAGSIRKGPSRVRAYPISEVTKRKLLIEGGYDITDGAIIP